MKPISLSQEIADAALLMVRSQPGVEVEVLRNAMTIGADLGIAFALKTIRETREEMNARRNASNLPQ